MLHFKPFLDLLDQMGPESMSSDEEEAIVFPSASETIVKSSRRYVVFQKSWRSDVLKAFLSRLDTIHLENLKSSSTSRHRVDLCPSLYSENPRVPTSLPRNCYSMQYLDRLNPQSFLLTTIKDDIDFLLSEDIC